MAVSNSFVFRWRLGSGHHDGQIARDYDRAILGNQEMRADRDVRSVNIARTAHDAYQLIDIFFEHIRIVVDLNLLDPERRRIHVRGANALAEHLNMRVITLRIERTVVLQGVDGLLQLEFALVARCVGAVLVVEAIRHIRRLLHLVGDNVFATGMQQARLKIHKVILADLEMAKQLIPAALIDIRT